jgi:hypothetical protein
LTLENAACLETVLAAVTKRRRRNLQAAIVRRRRRRKRKKTRVVDVSSVVLEGLLLLATRNIENSHYLFIHRTRATNADGAPVAEEKTE